MKYVSLFSGIEAASVAWEPLGWEPMASAEIDPFPCAVLAAHYPDVPNLGSVTEIDWSEFIATNGRPDVVVGGSPCQSFSTAGKREGLAGASGLMFEYIRAVQELMPRWFVWENVQGALTSEHGAAFGQLLSEMDALGYGQCWRVLDAQFFGVAQRRERVFLVGRLGGEPPAEVLFEREGLPWDFTTSRKKREELAARAGRGAQSAGFKFHQGGAGQEPR
jgi:DNA (cytosine-5)-methyltransferase 1